jgi:hypothetical protein
MKKILLFILGFASLTIQSQEIQDAVRYSLDDMTGTARFRAMSGAFGALGGDLSAINMNPASSVIFNTDQVGFTFSNHSKKNESTYFGTYTEQCDSSFDMNQFGSVFIFHNNDANWKKFAFAINYENENRLDNSVFSAGVNPTTSIDSYFLNYANGIPLGTLQSNLYALNYNEQQAFFGYNGYIISPISENLSNTQYVSEVPAGGNYYQDNYVESFGFNGKVAFNLATQYKDFLSFGINLNAHFVDFNRASSFYEKNTNDLVNGVQDVVFENFLYTYGSGFSVQVGAIIKATQSLRFGASYESPTWYNLNDEFTQRLYATNRVNGVTFNDVVDPRILNIYPSYEVQTPEKWSASAAYIFGKSGLISFDYTLKNYSHTKLKPENDYVFRNLNTEMANTLNNANEFRLGAEYKIKELSLRGGYRFEESPYKNGKTLGDLTGFSGGLGYNFGYFKLDFAYSYSQRKSQEGFFTTGLTSPAFINTITNSFTTSFIFEL